MRPSSTTRSGYAMLLVLAFILLFLAVLGVAYRQIGAAIRIESVRVQQVQRDEGSLHALARSLTLLETGRPPASPYMGSLSVATTQGIRFYVVTFTSQGGNDWSITVSPATDDDAPPLLPNVFGKTSP